MTAEVARIHHHRQYPYHHLGHDPRSDSAGPVAVRASASKASYDSKYDELSAGGVQSRLQSASDVDLHPSSGMSANTSLQTLAPGPINNAASPSTSTTIPPPAQTTAAAVAKQQHSLAYNNHNNTTQHHHQHRMSPSEGGLHIPMPPPPNALAHGPPFSSPAPGLSQGSPSAYYAPPHHHHQNGYVQHQSHPPFFSPHRPASPSSLQHQHQQAPPPHDVQAAMMYAAFQQQQHHFHQQMALMAANNNHSNSNDPRRRTGSLPNQHPQQPYYFQQQQQQQQANMYHPYPQHQQCSQHPHHPQQAMGYHGGPPPPPPSSSSQFHHPAASASAYPGYHAAHASFSGAYPSPSPPVPRAATQTTRERSPTAPSGSSSSSSVTPPPVAPFAGQHQQRPASPARSVSATSPIDSQARRRTESQPSDPRWQPPPQAHAGPSLSGAANLAPSTLASRGRTESSTSDPRSRPGPPASSPSSSGARIHSPSSSISTPAPSQSQRLAHQHAPVNGYAAAMQPSRLRTDSGSSSSGSSATAVASVGARSASPASSDRAPTPTQQSKAFLQPALPNAQGKPALAPGTAGQAVQRKASPLSQGHSTLASSAASNRSVTPTQSSPFTAPAPGRPEQADSDAESDDTASDRPKGHRTTGSNASSTMTSGSSSAASPGTPTSSGKGSSMFRSKLRKALSLSELNNHNGTGHGHGHGSGSSGSSKGGRVSLTSNSSSSDTSHSTLEPRTPPNGVSPVLPSSFASASATNLHASSGERPGHNAGGSLPANAGRRFGLLNSKMNSSTDNISISSTVSSASVMLRKMASFGKLGRKSSVRSLSNLFHRERSTDSNMSGSDAVSEFGVPGAAATSSSGKDRKKGGVANPSVAHVTVEVESGANNGMTPAEALVRSHQEKERARLEQEAAKRRAVESASAIPLGSPKSKLLEKEKEKLKNASGGKKGGKKWGMGAFSRSASSSSLRADAAAATAAESNTSSPASSVAPSPIFEQSAPMSANTSAASEPASAIDIPTHKEHVAAPDTAFRPSLDTIQLDAWRKADSSTLPAGAIQYDEDEADSFAGDEDEGFDDRTPRGSIEILGDDQHQHQHLHQPGPYSDWDGEPPNASFFEDDTASFTETTGRHFPEPEDVYDDGGHDGRFGQKIPERPPHHVRPAKGILKNARSFSQQTLARPNPAFLRPRASSYDAPTQLSPPNQPGRLAALAQVIPSKDQVDGVAAHPATAPRLDTRAASPTREQIIAEKENISPSSSSASYSGPYGNPAHNASAPVLANPASVAMTSRSMTGPALKRNISFAQNLSVHTTWPGTIYDRRGETATCNRLTPQLAQRIKEELNAFKMEEMEVHHSSRNFTHFFV